LPVADTLLAGRYGVETIDGLRERKRVRTRDAIRDAAQVLFLERGFAGTTVDDIAEAADVSPRTFFRYFASKEEVLFSRFDETLDLLREFLHSRPPEQSVGAALREASQQFASLDGAVSTDRAIFDIFQGSEALHARYLQSFFRLEMMTAEWIATRTGLPSDDVVPRTVAAVLASGARVALDVWVEQPDRDLRELLEPSLRMIEAALAPSPAG
jgi:AcrR family transcriptional regulator